MKSVRLLAFSYAARSLRRSPGFLAVAVVSLGLGLALTTTVAAVIDAVLRPYVPYQEPDRLFRIVQYGDGASHRTSTSETYAALRGGTSAFEGVAAMSPGAVVVRAGSHSDEIAIAVVSSNFFEVLGVEARLGRLFSAREPAVSVEGTAVVSYEFWRRTYPGRTTVGDATVNIGDRSYTIIGVTPPGLQIFTEPQVWLLGRDSSLTGSGFVVPMVRLSRHATIADARAQLNLVAARLTTEYGSGYRPFGFEVLPARNDPLRLQRFHLAMAGAAVAVLLIACANLANLMLARGISKEREFALRMTLGATRATIARQVLAECALIALAGLALGLVLSLWGVEILSSNTPPYVQWVGILKPQLSWRVFATAAVASVLSALTFGLLPALRASAVDLAEPLKDAASTTTGYSRRRYSVLVAGEIALTLLLVMGAGLLLKATRRIGDFDFGYSAHKVWSVYAGVPPARGMSRAQTQVRENQVLSALETALRHVSGVREVAEIEQAATLGGEVTTEQASAAGQRIPHLLYWRVSPNVLRTLGVPVLEGRDFNDADIGGSGVAIIDQDAAAALWPNQSATGQMLKLGGLRSEAAWVRVIGVSGKAILSFDIDTDYEPEPSIYVVRGLEELGPGFTHHFIVGAVSEDPKMALGLSRASLIISERGAMVVPWLEDFGRIVNARQFIAGVFVLLGAFGLVLAGSGLYGVLFYAVSQRRREFGVRIALGAARVDILKLVLRDGIVMALAGTGFGALFAIWAANLLSFWLYTVSPSDVVSLVLSEALLFAVSLTACVAPALTAMNADPVEILRAS